MPGRENTLRRAYEHSACSNPPVAPNTANTTTMPARMMTVSVGMAKHPYSSSSRLDWFRIVGAQLTTAPQLLQVGVVSGALSCDLDACIATVQTGQGCIRNCEAPMFLR